MASGTSPEQWLRAQCEQYSFDVQGVYQTRGRLTWPLTAEDADDLLDQISRGAHLLPLPKEPAALANVLEVSIVDFLISRVAEAPGADAVRGTERGYPDLEITGDLFGGGFHAVDIKIAQRKRLKRGGVSKNTKSRVTLYTGNTYFRYPQLHWPGTPRPFNEFASHLDVIGVYTLDEAATSRVRDLELIVQPPWKIASRTRSSTTREYIGAVVEIDALREGRGVFATPEEFYTFWRKYPFRIGRAVQQQLDRLLEDK